MLAKKNSSYFFRSVLVSYFCLFVFVWLTGYKLFVWEEEHQLKKGLHQTGLRARL